MEPAQVLRVPRRRPQLEAALRASLRAGRCVISIRRIAHGAQRRIWTQLVADGESMHFV